MVIATMKHPLILSVEVQRMHERAEKGEKDGGSSVSWNITSSGVYLSQI